MDELFALLQHQGGIKVTSRWDQGGIKVNSKNPISGLYLRSSKEISYEQPVSTDNEQRVNDG